MTDNPTPELDPAKKRKRTALFTVSLVAVLAAFVGLSMLGGPPQMPLNEKHKLLKEDTACLACHNWPGKLPVPLPEGFKPMSENHPPPRPKKLRPVMTDAGVPEAPPVQFECLKCHIPH